MGKPYSLDLRNRVVAAIEGGMSRNQAAKQFGVAIVGPISIPVASLAAQGLTVERQTTRQYDGGIWFPEPVVEMTVLSEQYDFAISLLLLPKDPPFEDRFSGSSPGFAANKRTF